MPQRRLCGLLTYYLRALECASGTTSTPPHPQPHLCFHLLNCSCLGICAHCCLRPRGRGSDRPLLTRGLRDLCDPKPALFIPGCRRGCASGPGLPTPGTAGPACPRLSCPLPSPHRSVLCHKPVPSPVAPAWNTGPGSCSSSQENPPEGLPVTLTPLTSHTPSFPQVVPSPPPKLQLHP